MRMIRPGPSRRNPEPGRTRTRHRKSHPTTEELSDPLEGKIPVHDISVPYHLLPWKVALPYRDVPRNLWAFEAPPLVPSHPGTDFRLSTLYERWPMQPPSPWAALMRLCALQLETHTTWASTPRPRVNHHEGNHRRLLGVMLDRSRCVRHSYDDADPEGLRWEGWSTCFELP